MSAAVALGHIDPLLNSGFSLIPCGLDKRPLNLMRWKRWQAERPDQKQITGWLKDGPASWAIVTGAISRIIAIDFDGAEGEQLRKELGLRPNVKTGRGGHHVWFWHPGWHVPTLNGKAKRELGARWPGVDVKGDGGYAITVGRSEFGNYQLLNPQIEDRERLPLEFRRDVGLLDPKTVRNAKQAEGNGNALPNPAAKPPPSVEAAGQPLAELLLDRYLAQAVPGSRNSAGFDLACQLRDNDVEQAEAERVLCDYAQRVPEHDHSYTEGEALASVRAAYGRLPREPWSARCSSSNGSRTVPNGEASPNGTLEEAAPSVEASANGSPKRGDWPKPMRPEAFQGVAGEIVRAAEPETEADPHAILMTLLVYCGNVFGRSPYFYVAGATHYANEFVAIVGETGASGRKGTSADMDGPVVLADETFDQRKSTGLSSGEGVIQAVRDPKWKVRKAKEGETPDEDGLYRELEDEGVDDKRLCVSEGELSGVFRKMERSGNVLRETLCDAWDGKTLSTLTRNSLKATGAHISILGHVTPAALRETLSDTTIMSGLGNRILWCCSKRSKLLPRGGTRIDWRPHNNDLTDAFTFARVGEIGMSDEAWELWEREYERLTSNAGGLLGAATDRGEAHTRRLALIYAVLDRSLVVEREHLEAALAVWDYCFDSARYLFGHKTGNATADEILIALRRHGTEGMTRTQINDLFGRNRQKGQIEDALATLAKHGLAFSRSQPSSNGRPAELWVATGEDGQ